ncbi:magnesium transporter [Paenibacillus eucommiae]|uniref:Magnesium transporter MgtE n=1 Tax=Paenibacillus eucommiae TaxID=1355755 RepID=A0ABS4J2G4_9BACL|nr:magnesium transporter [Paenibacillus eucommiae]MBP1994017.1 magnesium transporter [Paenibacillus eucommiae]
MYRDLNAGQMVDRIEQLMTNQQYDEFQLIIDELQPFDIAILFNQLPEELRPHFLGMLETRILTDMIQELETSAQYQAIRMIGSSRAAEVMDEMDNDDLATFLHSLSDKESDLFLSSMNISESGAVRKLMTYPAETAGRIMTNRYVWIPQHYTVKEASGKIREFADISETISYLYVIDEDKKLLGVVSYRDLILAEPHHQISQIMHSRVISVDVGMDQEQVADVIRNYDFTAVPVVDPNHVLIGIITVDDIIDIVYQEANEDIQKLSGSGKDIDFNTKPTTAAFRRLPWLILLLFIGLISGTIISRFEDTLNQIVALTFFMPMIAGMTGNTGTQSLAVVVRGLISKKLSGKEVRGLIIRELLVGLIIGLTCGILITLLAYVWQGSLMLGFVVGISLISTLIIGTIAGTVIPLLLNKLKIDPAVASGPLITTLNDVLSLFIYFGIATLFISYLV